MAERARANPGYLNGGRGWDERTDRWLEKEERKLYGRLNAEVAQPLHLNTPAAESFRFRYRTYPAFREREIARTWARKAASGVLRTDGRTDRRVSEDGTLTPSVIVRLFQDAVNCSYCREPMRPREKTLDHKTPVSKGGLHSIHNVCICCSSCNSRKGASDYDVWLAKRAA